MLCVGVYSSDKREYTVEEAQIFDLVDKIISKKVENRRIIFESYESSCIEAMKEYSELSNEQAEKHKIENLSPSKLKKMLNRYFFGEIGENPELKIKMSENNLHESMVLGRGSDDSMIVQDTMIDIYLDDEQD